MVNKVLNFLDRRGLQWLLIPIIFLGYLKNGKKIKSVAYVKKLKIWVFHVKNDFFVSRGPGWAYDIEFLEHVYTQYSGFAYRPGPGDVVIDVGAGLGEESLLFSKWVGPEGKVFSIEANPATFAGLRYLITLNKLSNVKADWLAISNFNGKTLIEDNDDRFLQNTIVGKANASGKITEVNCCTLDEYFDQNAIVRADFLRVNIEGAEQLLVEGMNSSVNKIKHVVISCHDFREGSDFYKTREKIMRFLSFQNFTILYQQTGNAVRDNYLYATNNSIG